LLREVKEDGTYQLTSRGYVPVQPVVLDGTSLSTSDDTGLCNQVLTTGPESFASVSQHCEFLVKGPEVCKLVRLGGDSHEVVKWIRDIDGKLVGSVFDEVACLVRVMDSQHALYVADLAPGDYALVPVSPHPVGFMHVYETQTEGDMGIRFREAAARIDRETASGIDQDNALYGQVAESARADLEQRVAAAHANTQAAEDAYTRAIETDAPEPADDDGVSPKAEMYARLAGNIASALTNDPGYSQQARDLIARSRENQAEMSAIRVRDKAFAVEMLHRQYRLAADIEDRLIERLNALYQQAAKNAVESIDARLKANQLAKERVATRLSAEISARGERWVMVPSPVVYDIPRLLCSPFHVQ
jgi:hypothetical protein